MPAKADSSTSAPLLMGGLKKRHCYICKQVSGAAEKRKEFAESDPIIVIYPSTPRCKPCQRLMARKSYRKRRDEFAASRAAAHAALKAAQAAKKKGSGSVDASPAAADA